MPFRKGEILTVISKDEEQWWTAMNSLGQTGSIPVPYVQKVRKTDEIRPSTVLFLYRYDIPTVQSSFH